MDKRTEEILNKVYNLILDTEIHKNERDILLRYKTLLENTKNEQRVVMELAEALRQHAVSGIHSQKSLSPKVATFYKENEQKKLTKFLTRQKIFYINLRKYSWWDNLK